MNKKRLSIINTDCAKALCVLLLVSNVVSSRDTLCAAEGLNAHYSFQQPAAGNPSAVKRIDTTINFSGSPIPGYPSTYFDVIWTGSILAPISGTYSLTMTCDDCARLWIGNSWVAERLSFSGGSELSKTVSIDLQKNVSVPLLLHYWQLKGAMKIKLEWSGPGIERQVIPATALSTLGWPRIEAPATSYESPVSAILHLPPNQISEITVSPTVRLIGAVQDLSPTTKWAEVNLNKSNTTNISLTVNSENATKQIQWVPLDFSSSNLPDKISIRANSSLLVKARLNGALYVNNGYDRLKSKIMPIDGIYQLKLSTPGVYDLDDGLGGKKVTVTVISVESDPNTTLTTSVAEFTYSQIPLLPKTASDYIKARSFDHTLQVYQGKRIATGEPAAGVVNYSAGKIAKGIIQNKENGSIIQAFNTTGVSWTSSHATIERTLPDGSQEGYAYVNIWPFTDNLEYTFTMRAHKATFAQGGKSFTIKTDGTNTSLGEPGFIESLDKEGKRIGLLKFKVLFPPGEEKWCFSAFPKQFKP